MKHKKYQYVKIDSFSHFFVCFAVQIPPLCPFLLFLASVKKRKNVHMLFLRKARIFDRFRVLKTKNRASGRLINRLKTRKCLLFQYFCLKCKKKRLLSWQTKDVLLWRRQRDSNPTAAKGKCGGPFCNTVLFASVYRFASKTAMGSHPHPPHQKRTVQKHRPF